MLANTDLAPEQYHRCAVVGSSSRLEQTEHGQAIDEADTIIRFNDAPVKGREALIGKRCTIRAVTG